MTAILMAARILVLLSCMGGCIYGIIVMHRGFRPSYFNIALCGMFAFLLARLFFFVLSLSDGEDIGYSVGIFGEAAAYLFYIVANRAYVPLELEERDDRRLCLPAAAAAAALCAVFAWVAVVSGSVGAILGEAVYIVTMGPATYYAVKSSINKYHNPFRTGLTPFNLCMIVLVAVNAVNEINTVAVHGTARAIVTVALAVISAPALISMLPLLRKGLIEWEI